MLRKSRIFVVAFFVISFMIFVTYHIIRFLITDRTVPVIEMESDSITVSVRGGDEAILEGVTAKDGKDGDITDNLFIESRSTFLDKGRFNVTIAVADYDNHVVKAVREIIYSDYCSPQFSLTGPLKFQLPREGQDDLNIASGLSVNDVIDGNISNRIKISSEFSINIYEPGDYHMEFVVTNSMGDTVKLPTTITLYRASDENSLPQILLSKYLINTPVGTKVDLKSLVDSINYHNVRYIRGDDGNFYSEDYGSEEDMAMISSDSIRIDSEIDWDLPGVYEVIFTYTDVNTDTSNNIRCYIVVY